MLEEIYFEFKTDQFSFPKKFRLSRIFIHFHMLIMEYMECCIQLVQSSLHYFPKKLMKISSVDKIMFRIIILEPQMLTLLIIFISK